MSFKESFKSQKVDLANNLIQRNANTQHQSKGMLFMPKPNTAT